MTLGSGPSGSRENFLGDGRSFCDSLGGGASLALAPVILTLGAGLPETTFRRRPKLPQQLGNPAPSLARAPLFWRWGLARRASRNILAHVYPSESVDFGCGWPISHCPVQAVYQRPGRGRNPARARRVPFFATRRIIEGLGLGLARRAARKLVPVVWTLGSGPSGFPRKLSARRPKLPRQPWQTRAVVRARSFIAALGAGPSGFPKQLRGDGRSFRDSRGKPAPSFARVLLFWRWGLARRASRNNFPGDGQSICDSVPRARFRRFSAGEWPEGFLKQVSERCKLPLPSFETSFRAMQSGGILDAAAAYAARSLCRNTGPDYQGRGPGQWPQWPFYQQADNWPDLKIRAVPFCKPLIKMARLGH